MKVLNVRAETVKLLEENRDKFLSPLIWQWSIKYDTKSIKYEQKMDKLDVIKVENFCASKDTVKK